MVRIGITGGIGMGKTTAVRFLRSEGFSVIDTDDVARELTQTGAETLSRLVRVFGEEILDPHGALDRAKMAALVFADPDARSRLEGILHPAIRDRWESVLNGWDAAGLEIGFVVIPLLFEKGYESCFTSVVCVACTARTQRLRWRDRGWSEAEGDRRNRAQLPVDEKMARSGIVIWTEGRMSAHEHQWRHVVAKWTRMTAR